jgi:hypothetical protein
MFIRVGASRFYACDKCSRDIQSMASKGWNREVVDRVECALVRRPSSMLVHSSWLPLDISRKKNV